MVNKPFNQALHDLCDPPARQAVIKYGKMKWNVDFRENPDIYGIDLLGYIRNILCCYIEIETRDWRNESLKCPYPSIHIPARKEKFFQKKHTLYFVVTRDFKSAYWIPTSEIIACEKKEVSNNSVKQGEYFYDVPISKFTFVEDLHEPF